MILKAYISGYGNTLFPIVSGAVHVENINEQLDSFAFTIANYPSNLSLEPLKTFVRIVDADNNNAIGQNFNKLFVVDNWTSEENNKSGTKYYIFQINLCSPLKILEDVILPNRNILHSKVRRSLTIGEAIKQMCELYMPRVKQYVGESEQDWAYKPLFSWENVINDEKFNVDCPDFSWGNPSLRDVITTLMQYVGCIPIIKNDYSISYIDLRKGTIAFNSHDKDYFVTRSNSSDSFVNTLVNSLENTLDEGNTVVNEIIGFRDMNDFALKQKENLFLTTNFGIERVEKLIYHSPRILDCYFSTPDNGRRFVYFTSYKEGEIYNDTLHEMRVVLNYYSVEYVEETANTIVGNRKSLSSEEITIAAGGRYNFLSPYNDDRNATPNKPGLRNVIRIDMYVNGKKYITDTVSYLNSSRNIYVEKYLNKAFDITELVYERNQRSLLDKDFTKVAYTNRSNVDFDIIKNNYFTTLEFSYGQNTISGFSNSFSWFTPFIGSQTSVFIEILDAYFTSIDGNHRHDTTVDDYVRKIVEEYGWIIEDTSDAFANVVFTAYDIKTLQTSHFSLAGSVPQLAGYSEQQSTYAFMVFDITYVPFNSLKTKFFKNVDEIPFMLEKPDSQESSIITFDEFSKREQEKIDRLGNDSLTIKQPCAKYNELNEIGMDQNQDFCTYEDATIFQRQVAYYTDFCEATYQASKNYIMKYYFTALQNKYRAYEYVDRSQAVVRKENVTVFVRISHDYISRASDKITALDYQFLASSLTGNIKPLTYTFIYGAYITPDMEEHDFAMFKQDVSVLTSETAIILSYNDLDNASYGNYLRPFKDLSTDEGSWLSGLGGIIQAYYMHWNSTENELGYNVSHVVGFVNASVIPADEEILDVYEYDDLVINSTKFPMVDRSIIPEEAFQFQLRDQLSDNNSGQYDGGSRRYYYKSIDEKINETVQFEYYAKDKDIKFTKHFINYNGLKQQIDRNNIVCIASDDGSLNENSYIWDGSHVECTIQIVYPYEEFRYSGVGVQFTPSVPSSVSKFLKISYLYDRENLLMVDLFSFDFSEDDTIYFSVNDTKTDKVYNLNNESQLYELTKVIKMNVSSRQTEDVENV